MIMKWLERILLILLAIAVLGIAVTTICKAKQVSRQTDAYCRYLDEKYGWTWEEGR